MGVLPWTPLGGFHPPKGVILDPGGPNDLFGGPYPPRGHFGPLEASRGSPRGGPLWASRGVLMALPLERQLPCGVSGYHGGRPPQGGGADDMRRIWVHYEAVPPADNRYFRPFWQIRLFCKICDFAYFQPFAVKSCHSSRGPHLNQYIVLTELPKKPEKPQICVNTGRNVES